MTALAEAPTLTGRKVTVRDRIENVPLMVVWELTLA
jgi:hypothetical protein